MIKAFSMHWYVREINNSSEAVAERRKFVRATVKCRDIFTLNAKLTVYGIGRNFSAAIVALSSWRLTCRPQQRSGSASFGGL